MSSDCPAGDVCEDLVCRAGACGDDAECSLGRQCIGGDCAAPLTAASVTSCVVLPPTAVVNAGGVRSFSVVAYSASGAAIPYEAMSTQPIQWTISNLVGTLSTTGGTTATLLAANALGRTGTVGATIGQTSCTAATVVQYPAVANGVRVVVIDQNTGSPVSGAVVEAENGTTATTGASGYVTFTSLTSAQHTLSVFDASYAYVTVMATTATDILIPLRPNPNPASFTGTLTSADFAMLSNELGTLHVDVSGASLPPNLIDTSVPALLGPSQSMTISLGTSTSYGPYNIPEGIALGLGPTMFGPGAAGGQYGITPTPGYRALWSLGGNAVIGDVLQVIGPFLSGGMGSASQELPTILTASLPIVGTLESGVTSGVPVTPGEVAMLTYGTSPQPALENDTLLRLHTSVKTAVLESYTDDTGASTALDCELVLGGVLAPTQGFVPLGLTSGVDEVNASGAMMPDGLTDPATTGAPEQELPLRLAPRHGGLETAPWAYVTLAATMANLSGETSTGTIVAGTVVFQPTTLEYNEGATTPVDLSHPFLPIPSGASFGVGLFTPPAPVAGATFHRLDIGSGTSQWLVYFPASLDSAAATAIPLPTPPVGFANRATMAGATATLNTVSLGYPPPGTTTLETYDGAVRFDGVDLDDLSLETDSFTVRVLPAASP